MNFKKAVCAALLLVTNFCGIGGNALYINSHYAIGEKIAEKIDANISENEKNAFLSGIVYADIGRIKFDKKTGVESDSEKFVAEIKKLAKTDEEKWFARGFEVHVFQDSETRKFLEDVLNHEYSSYPEYALNCGTLECYFMKKYGVLYNEFLDRFNFKQITDGINLSELSKNFNVPEESIEKFAVATVSKYSRYPKKINLNIYDDLIRKTYKSLGADISLDDIHEQAGDLLGVCMVISAFVGSKVEVSEELASKIEEKSEKLADLCVSKMKIKI